MSTHQIFVRLNKIANETFNLLGELCGQGGMFTKSTLTTSRDA